MRKIKYGCNYGFVGTDINDFIEVEDDCTEEEINDIIYDIVIERVDFYWEEVK